MPSFSQVTLVGHLGGDPEMRFTPNGNPVTNFSVATSRRYTDSHGESKEDTQWWRVTAWSRLAELCHEYLAKGQLVLVIGDPKLRTWQRQDGSTGATLEVRANRVLFLSKTQKEEGTLEEKGEEIPAPEADEEEMPGF